VPTYVAFLRGVNVGGHNRMKMDELRDVCTSLGYAEVRTYIQSGNVVLGTAEADERALRAAIHDAIEDAFGYDVTVMARTREALEAVVAGTPFEGPDDGVRRYVTFLNEEPGEDRVEALQDAAVDGETFAVVGREVYSELDTDVVGDGRTTDAGRLLGTPATRRNWNVVTAVLKLSSS
jgi:uncharacterized protein (DUF1697 family)